MKNEMDKSKDKCKLPTLNAKQMSCETLSDEAKKKNKKGKKLKRNASNEEGSSTNKTKSFVRKYIFGQHAGASSSLDVGSTSSDAGVDRLSTTSSTSTLSLVKRHTPEGEDTSSLQEANEDANEKEGAVEDKDTVKPPLADNQFKPHHPVSVTPYPISTWRKKDNIVRQSRDTASLAYISHDVPHTQASTFMENKLLSDKSKKALAEDDKPAADYAEVRSVVAGVATTNKFEQEQIDSTSPEPVQSTIDVKKPDSPREPHSTTPEQVAVAMPAFGNLVMDNVKDRADSTSNVSHSPLERQEHLYKILVIGELGTGKTSIIKRYVHQFFSQHYRATIGVDFALKVLNWDANTIIRLQLWDIAGQERFGNMTRVYYKDAVGAFIVFDVTRVATFDAVVKWKQDLDSKVQLPDGSSIPCVLLGNKCDQQKEGTVNTPARMDEYCKEKGFAGWFETSAKENINIEEAAKFLVTKIFQNDKLLHSNEVNKDNDRIAINSKGEQNGQNLKSITKSCAC